MLYRYQLSLVAALFFTTVVQAAPLRQSAHAVIELFTSEGCSSCPAAEELVKELPAQFSKEYVYILAYHVDYWNYLGWVDAYSNHQNTLRQQGYARQFQLSGIYTPQVVVNGSTEFVGSNRHKLHQAIQTALQAQKPSRSLSIKITQKTNSNLIIECTRDQAVAGESLHVAMVQKNTKSVITSGENSGLTMQNVHVVRSLKTIQNSAKTAELEFTLPTGLTRDDVDFVGFLQNPNFGAIITVTQIDASAKVLPSK